MRPFLSQKFRFFRILLGWKKSKNPIFPKSQKTADFSKKRRILVTILLKMGFFALFALVILTKKRRTFWAWILIRSLLSWMKIVRRLFFNTLRSMNFRNFQKSDFRNKKRRKLVIDFSKIGFFDAFFGEKPKKIF